ncbi:protein FAR1-RELATED SEQUENCE 5-like [Salvia miltiorrhiza]|uniref:protein FAR1-RELATED SEQUENCE 5-like n=1 Tax=Salvia miltiorrhiza TaxID=226208 RepID=UPI0025ABAA9E|nr:protein FAR1-RELATED SEQUENCE 5-like [Salvia miltiorrhiza]
MDFDLNEYPSNDVGDENGNEDCDDNADVGYGDKDQSFEVVEENVEDEQDVEHDYQDIADLLNRIDVLEMVLEVGKPVKDPEAAHILYSEYARLMGFSVTKDNQGYFVGTRIWRYKTFLCACHGKSETKTSLDSGMATYKKQDRKTMCKAKLRVSRRRNQPWKVRSWYKEHNHELFPSDQSYLLRSVRSLSGSKKALIEAMNSAGISISRACAFMEKESGGAQNCGFTRKDAYNHINGIKMKIKVENSDANSLIQYFSKMSNNSTYRTNIYKLVCVHFVGVNHNLKNVMFGMSFLSDEATRSYEWLLSTFLESMHSKQSDIIFTDQCQSLMNAIDFVFPSASHRLCQWHINQNAPSHFGKLNGNTLFKNAWFHCMNGCDTEDEFEVAWMCMIDEYGLGENRWFNTMYGLKRRWSSVFTNQRFCAGLHATSCSEVTNKVIKNLCSVSTSLHDFVLKFEEVQIQWRRKEAGDDALCIGMLGLFVQNNELLNSAAKFLTSVFKKLEHEASYSMNVDLIKGPSSYVSDDIEFTVSSGCQTRAYQKRKLPHSDDVSNRASFDMPCGSQGNANPNDTPTSPWTHSDSMAYANIINNEEAVNPTPADISKGKANQQIPVKKACCQARASHKRKLPHSDDVSNRAPFAMPSGSHENDVSYDTTYGTWDDTFGWIHADSRTYVNIIDNEEPVIPNLE